MSSCRNGHSSWTSSRVDLSVYVKRRHPQARLLAFEPSPNTQNLLRRNIALRGLDEVTVADVALGARRGPVSDVTFTYSRSPGNSTRYPHEKERQKQVMARTLPAKHKHVHRGHEISVAVERYFATFLRPVRPFWTC